jgi:hypothetical protein
MAEKLPGLAPRPEDSLLSPLEGWIQLGEENVCDRPPLEGEQS